METKYVKVPFEVELAKKITSGEIGGRIVTRNGESARIVCFDRKDEFRPIIALVNSGDIEVHYAFCLNGKFVNDEVLDTHDLMLEIPEYMTFKDGDILYARTDEFWYVFIYRNNNKDRTCLYAAIDESDTLWIEDNRITSNDDISELRFATKAEKQKLIDALKASKEPKAKEYIKRFFPNHSNSLNIGKDCEFKPFDKVLARDNGGSWVCSLFSHISNSQKRYKYITVAGSFENCIPYNEQTAHLLGTTEIYE